MHCRKHVCRKKKFVCSCGIGLSNNMHTGDRCYVVQCITFGNVNYYYSHAIFWEPNIHLARVTGNKSNKVIL